MKLIIAVTFLGILMPAFAEEQCELMPPEEKFDSNKYFSVKHVYVTHSRNGPETVVCREYQTEKQDGKTVTTVTTKYKTGGQSYQSKIECTNTPKGSNGQFSSECKGLEGTGTGTSSIRLETSVIATDNEKYSILQVCSPGKPESDNILVLQTNKNGELPKEVKDDFKGVGWDIDTWPSRKTVNCDDIKSKT